MRDAIEKHQQVVGLDQLHTFTTKFLRALCGKYGLTTSRDEPLSSIYGKYVKQLRGSPGAPGFRIHADTH